MSTIVQDEQRQGVTAVAWYPLREMSFAQWAEHGRRLGIRGRSAGWWIGDWLTYGNAAYGERYVRAARITGYDVQTLMNMVYVATHIDASRRRETLSWSHHAEVVTLSEDEQELWLARAEQERLSVRDLRRAIQDPRGGGWGSSKEAAADARPSETGRHQGDNGYGQPVVCPSCGEQFRLAEDAKIS